MVVEKKAPLEDLMAAMDVVDTLRHQEGLVERELDTEARRARLLERLRELYQAQGIEVTDDILNEGILALEEERFQYKPVEQNFATRMAHIWVSRKRWGKPFSFLTVLGTLFLCFYIYTDVLPERAAREQLPQQLQTSMLSIEELAKRPEIVAQAQEQLTIAEQALQNEDFNQANEILNEMELVRESLQQSYTIRVLSKANQNSGIWRVPDINTNSRNYYLIVEAIDNNNNVLELSILSEESNKYVDKEQWGLRVNEETFYQIAQDKQDDGIIQSNTVGEKKIGYLQPEFIIPTTGGTITEW